MDLGFKHQGLWTFCSFELLNQPLLSITQLSHRFKYSLTPQLWDIATVRPWLLHIWLSPSMIWWPYCVYPTSLKFIFLIKTPYLQDRALSLSPYQHSPSYPPHHFLLAFLCFFAQPKALDFLIHHLRFIPLVPFSLLPISSAMSPYLNFIHPSWPSISAISSMKPPQPPSWKQSFPSVNSCDSL